MTLAPSEQLDVGAGHAPAPTRILRFTVPGRAQPAGSKKAVPLGKTGRYGVIDDNPKSKGWKEHVARWVRPRYTDRPLESAIRLDVTFYLPRPLTHLAADGSPNTAGRARPYPTVRPDVLKLARGLEDALTGLVYADDAQIVSEHLHKRYSDQPRVEITITELAA